MTKFDSSIQEPQDERKHYANKNARRNRGIKGEVATLDPNVAG
jgi:hypothetical protein